MVFGRRRRRPPRARQPADQDPERSRLELAYELVWLRTLDKDVQMWQAPALALTAQSFLMTVALGADTARAARMLSSGLAALISLMSIQLMTKHQWLLWRDIAQLQRLEDRVGLSGINYRTWGLPDSGTDPSHHRQTRPTYWRKKPSVSLWQAGMAIFGLVALLIFVLSVFTPGVLTA